MAVEAAMFERRGAFTLVECSVALFASGAAIALGLAAANGSRADAMTAQSQVNLRAIGQASAMYTLDSKGWIVGSPGTSGRGLLNDRRAAFFPALDVNGDAAQPMDWAGPLAWAYLNPDAPRPVRRDERFALLNGAEIPDYTNPAFDPDDVDLTPGGPFEVFADPAQASVSIPFFDGRDHPDGVAGTAFVPRLASSYIAAREFLWWGTGADFAKERTPGWANAEEFWGSGNGFLFTNGSSTHTLPGAGASGGATVALQPSYRPFVDRLGDPARKIFLAEGTRFLHADSSRISHDVSARSGWGGAFADVGAWSAETRAWPEGLNASGQDMTRISFRRGAGPDDYRGSALFFDGAVALKSIENVRRPELWLPRGTLVSTWSIDEAIRDQYPEDVPGPFEFVSPRTRINH